jgi:hypothetical protein
VPNLFLCFVGFLDAVSPLRFFPHFLSPTPIEVKTHNQRTKNQREMIMLNLRHRMVLAGELKSTDQAKLLSNETYWFAMSWLVPLSLVSGSSVAMACFIPFSTINFLGRDWNGPLQNHLIAERVLSKGYHRPPSLCRWLHSVPRNFRVEREAQSSCVISLLIGWQASGDTRLFLKEVEPQLEEKEAELLVLQKQIEL